MRHSAIPRWLVLLLMLSAPPLFGDSLTRHLTFEARQQSIWGPGGAAPSTRRFTLVDPNQVKWNFSTSGYSAYQPNIARFDTYFFGEKEIGAGVRASSNGAIGLWSDLTVTNPGSVDVVYPVTPTLTFPDANSFRAGDTVAIGSSYSTDAGWSLATVSPQFRFSLHGQFDVFAEASAKLCVFDCIDTTSFLPSVDVGGGGPFEILSVSPGNQVSTPPELGLFIPVSATVRVPNIATSGALASDQRTITASGSDMFFQLRLDLAAIAESLFRLPPLSFDTQDYERFTNFRGIRLHYLVVGAELATTLNATQSFRFKPDLKVAFTFPQPLEYYIVSGGSVGDPHTASSVEMHVGETLYVKTAAEKQPMNVGPTFRLDNEFRSATGFSLAEDVEVEAGDFGVTIPQVEIIPELCTPSFCVPAVKVAGVTIVPGYCVPEICTPSVNVGPFAVELAGDGSLYEQTFPIASQNLGNIFEGTWQLGGFSTHTVSTFALDPENPIVGVDQETRDAINLGAGKRRVSFTIDITNPGDVVLSKLHVEHDLAAALASARSFRVERILGCDLDLNAGYDGRSNTELLASGNTLGVGETKRLIVVVEIAPQPDPSPYTSGSDGDGRSPLDTLVQSSDSSSVLLGPAVIEGADDYVLFGDHFVKFESSGNVFGTVGSNDFIEVKNGRSGIVAGDLRARRYMKVQGEITADYAWSGGIVDIVRQARLNLSGNVKQFANLPRFQASTPPFIPNGSLAGNIWIRSGLESANPGYYDSVRIEPGSTLMLSSGTYHIESLEVAGTLHLQAPIALYVRDRLEVGDHGRIAGAGETRETTIHALQSGAITIGEGAELRGSYSAPRANLFLGPDSSLEGSAYAKSITLSDGASASFHRKCDPATDPDCDGMPDCVN